jgi:hypothetical protein
MTSSPTRTVCCRALILVFTLTAVLVATGVPAHAADNPNGFVRNRAPLNQTITALVKGRFYEEVRCLEACVVTTQIGIGPEDARRLGFPNVAAGQYYVVGQVSKRLPAGAWQKIFLPLNPSVKERVAASTTGVKIAGRLVARSTKSNRHGWANWFRTCKLPPS